MSVPSASDSIPQATAALPLASAGAGGRIRVPGYAGHPVEGLGPDPEFRGVGLADDDRTGRLEAFDVELVLLGNEVSIDGVPSVTAGVSVLCGRRSARNRVAASLDFSRTQGFTGTPETQETHRSPRPSAMICAAVVPPAVVG